MFRVGGGHEQTVPVRTYVFITPAPRSVPALDFLQIRDVRAHRALCAGGLLAPDRALDVAMLAQDLGPVDAAADVDDQLRLQDFQDPAGEGQEEFVARGGGEDLVEA